MEIKTKEISKDEMEVTIGNITLVEILRVYLNQDSAVVFAAWKREHPTENPILKIKTKGKTPQKALNNAIENLTKDLDGLENDFKKSIK